MQPLTAAPREHLAEDQVRYLLTTNGVTFDGGIELVDATGNALEDIGTIRDKTSALISGQVRWDNRAAVHGSFGFQIQRPLAWGRDRIRPYQEIRKGDLSARFWLGVYIPRRPDEKRGESPLSYDVTAFGTLSIYQNGPADTREVPAGTTYAAALNAIHAASGHGGQLLLPGELYSKTLPATRVWAVMSPLPSWLRMMTDLLFEIGYTAPFEDQTGRIRTRPIQQLVDRGAEWVHDTRDQKATLVHPDRQLGLRTDDETPNYWRFIWSDKPGTPVEGNGIWTTENLTEGDASQSALGGLVVRKWVPLQAESHAAMLEQARKIKAEDMASERTLTLLTESLPVMGFDDVFEFVDQVGDGPDAGVDVEKLLAASWQLNLDGAPGQLVLGGPPREPLDEISTSGRATVTNTAPLRVVVDGATVSSFANALNAASYDVGDRVTVTIRNPLPPLVLGVES